MRSRKHYVRRTPKIYGNLQPQRRSWSPLKLGRFIKRIVPIVLLSGLVYLVGWSPAFTVRRVDVQGAALVSPEQVAALVPLGGSIWRLPREEIRAAVMALPAVDDVLISRGLPDTVRLELIERGAGIRWQSGDTISVLDSSGVVFVQRPVTPPEQLAESTPLDALPLVVDTSALPVTLGQQVVGRLVIQFIRTAEEERARLLPDYPLDHFAVTTSTNQVTLVTKNGLEVLLATIHDPGVQMRNLARMAAADALTRATVVDLRVDRWAYVR